MFVLFTYCFVWPIIKTLVNGACSPTKEGEFKARCQKHFMEVLNRPVPEVIAEVDDTNVMTDTIVIVEITIRKEIMSALRETKSGRAPGINNITADLLRADTDTTVNILYGLFNKIWEEEMAPEEFTRRLIITLAKKGDFGNGEVSPSCPL